MRRPLTEGNGIIRSGNERANSENGAGERGGSARRMLLSAARHGWLENDIIRADENGRNLCE